MTISITSLPALPGAAASLVEANSDALSGGGFAAFLAGQVSGLEALFSSANTPIDPALSSALPGNAKKTDKTASLLNPDANDAQTALATLSQFAPFTPHQDLSQASPGETADDLLLGAGKGGNGGSSELFALFAQTRRPRADTPALLSETPTRSEDSALATPATAPSATSTRPGEQAAQLPQNTPSITAALHDNKWSQQLSDRVLWLARGDVQNAQINITPAHLGPIQINLSLNGEQMSAQFVSAHQEVRQALEEALPRLREMLAGAGINLGQANVGSQQQQHSGAERFSGGENFRQNEDGAILPADSHGTDAALVRPLQRGQGLVDLFA